MKAHCPECGRLVKCRKNRFGDWVYNHHKICVSWSEMDMDDYKPGHNPAAEPSSQLDCPMSGQAADCSTESR